MWDMIRWVKGLEREMETLEKEENEYNVELPPEDAGEDESEEERRGQLDVDKENYIVSELKELKLKRKFEDKEEKKEIMFSFWR